MYDLKPFNINKTKKEFFAGYNFKPPKVQAPLFTGYQPKPINFASPSFYGRDIKGKTHTKPKKDLTYPEAWRFYKLDPFGDADGDGVPNWRDCKPYDPMRQGRFLEAAKSFLGRGDKYPDRKAIKDDEPEVYQDWVGKGVGSKTEPTDVFGEVKSLDVTPKGKTEKRLEKIDTGAFYESDEELYEDPTSVMRRERDKKVNLYNELASKLQAGYPLNDDDYELYTKLHYELEMGGEPLSLHGKVHLSFDDFPVGYTSVDEKEETDKESVSPTTTGTITMEKIREILAEKTETKVDVEEEDTSVERREREEEEKKKRQERIDEIQKRLDEMEKAEKKAEQDKPLMDKYVVLEEDVEKLHKKDKEILEGPEDGEFYLHVQFLDGTWRNFGTNTLDHLEKIREEALINPNVAGAHILVDSHHSDVMNRRLRIAGAKQQYEKAKQKVLDYVDEREFKKHIKEGLQTDPRAMYLLQHQLGQYAKGAAPTDTMDKWLSGAGVTATAVDKGKKKRTIETTPKKRYFSPGYGRGVDVKTRETASPFSTPSDIEISTPIKPTPLAPTQAFRRTAPPDVEYDVSRPYTEDARQQHIEAVKKKYPYIREPRRLDMTPKMGSFSGLPSGMAGDIYQPSAFHHRTKIPPNTQIYNPVTATQSFLRMPWQDKPKPPVQELPLIEDYPEIGMTETRPMGLGLTGGQRHLTGPRRGVFFDLTGGGRGHITSELSQRHTLTGGKPHITGRRRLVQFTL